MWDDVVSQRHKFVSAFVSYNYINFFLGVKKFPSLVFLTFPCCVPVLKNCVIFIGCNFEIRASQVRLHKQKKDTASAKEGKVSLLHRGRQSLGCALTYSTWSLEATNTLPWATDNIVQVTH